ncbi:hypothetical protein PG985_010348 [Apiospora marii]|uniref:uncharacterized protein n=1 Tax=Apiospora marii TaxID=335849 RepID=UPI00312F9365
MDFPELPAELLLMVFEHMAPHELLQLVQASPRCLSILQNMSGAALERFFGRILPTTQDKEIVHFHRPVTPLNALTSLVVASSAKSNVGITLWKIRKPDAVDKFHDFGTFWSALLFDEGDRPLSLERVERASDGLFDALREGSAHLEHLKSELLEHYAPFFSEEGLAAVNRRWDRDVASGQLDPGLKRYADTLPRAFACDISVAGVYEGKPRGLFTLGMKACRDVTRFTVRIRFKPEPRRDGDTVYEIEKICSEMLCEMGIPPEMIPE